VPECGRPAADGLREAIDEPMMAAGERPMLNGLRTIAHVFSHKIGFSRLGLALSVTIIIIAAFVLYHILRDMDLDALIEGGIGVFLRAYRAT